MCGWGLETGSTVVVRNTAVLLIVIRDELDSKSDGVPVVVLEYWSTEVCCIQPLHSYA
jgi:hypothetical protein